MLSVKTSPGGQDAQRVAHRFDAGSALKCQHRRRIIMWNLIWLLLALPQPLECSCVCIDGIAKTECRSATAARHTLPACLSSQPDQRCEPGEPPVTLRGVPLYEGVPAADCPEVRVWRAQSRQYDGVRVCDVRHGMRHNARPILDKVRETSVVRGAIDNANEPAGCGACLAGR